MLTAPSATPVWRSIRAGTPKPTAATSGVSSSRTAASSPSRSASCEFVGVGCSIVRENVPVGVDHPGQNLRSAKVNADHVRASHAAGYPTSPDGAGRKALPRLPRWTHEGQGSCADAGRDVAGVRKPRSLPAAHIFAARTRAARSSASPGGAGCRSASPSSSSSFGVWAVTGYLAVGAGVSDANNRLDASARAALAKQSGLLAATPNDDPRARHRQLEHRRTHGRHPLRLDPARAHRPVAPSDLVPLDPARPPRADPRAPATQKINAAMQIGGPALAIKTVPEFTGDPDQPRGGRQLRRLQGSDRRGRRGHDQRPEAHPLEPFRLSICDRAALRGLAWLALPQGLTTHERRASADLLAHPREPARPGRERPHPRSAAAGGDRCGHVEVDLAAHARADAVRRQVAREAARDRPLHLAADSARLGEVPGREMAAPCTAGSAATGIPAERPTSSRTRTTGA